MKKEITSLLANNCLFSTQRLSIISWSHIATQPTLKRLNIKRTLAILTPTVTQFLPQSWQQLTTISKAENWLTTQNNTCNFYAITLSNTSTLIGFLFLYIESQTKQETHVRLGYLLAQSVWKKGMGSELIEGLVLWASHSQLIKSIVGGVEKNNIGSIKVLTKNGFYKTPTSLPKNMAFYKITF